MSVDPGADESAPTVARRGFLRLASAVGGSIVAVPWEFPSSAPSSEDGDVFKAYNGCVQ
jgi:hypothetical protein